jgi:hypothetical protein
MDECDCRCAACGKLADTADLYERYSKHQRRQYPESFFKYCARAGDRIESQGWMIGQFRLPFCPECWAAGIRQPTPEDDAKLQREAAKRAYQKGQLTIDTVRQLVGDEIDCWPSPDVPG